jgi:integrase
MANKALSDRDIEQASARARRAGKEEWLSDPAPRGAGRLVVRCTAAGSKLAVFRYVPPAGGQALVEIGVLDTAGVRGKTLQQARERAAELSELYRSGVRDLRGHLEQQARAAVERQADEVRAQEQARAAAERGSLAKLLDAYVASLAGRQSQGNVHGLLKKHVAERHPVLVQRKAAEVQPHEVNDVLRALVDEGKGRTAAKVRAAMHAAYAAAARADLDASASGAFGGFGIVSNPVAPTAALTQFTKALDRALTAAEMRALHQHLLQAAAGGARDAVLTLLLLGGQRPTQLVRVTRADVDLHAKTVTLRDPKGRGRAAAPRVHVVPIIDELLPLIAARLETCTEPGAPLFHSAATATAETPALRAETLTGYVRDISAAMLKGGTRERGAFGLRDLRRTCETTLASIGVTQDVRAQLLSHGISGVQAKHYDRHSYAREKRAALQRLARFLHARPSSSVVTPIRAA